MVKKLYLLVTVVLVLPLTLGAEVYRTVDEQGNITYTDSPPADPKQVEKVEIQPGPSEESISDTMERNRAIRKAMEKAQEKRLEKSTERQDRLAKAEEDVEKAKKQLAAMEELGEDDRQHLQGGKSYIRPEYFERVKKAQRELDEAKKRLKKIRGY
jgi:DNA repair exonuclease SbcCD ATPase subunit